MIAHHDVALITALDLTPIKTKLMHHDSGEGWSQEKADTIEVEYRRFLYLMKTYPDEQTAPNVDVDTFWHYHILDTAKYARDCHAAFGYFLHHYPYLGLDSADGAIVQQQAGERLRVLYASTFGGVSTANVSPANTAWCGSPGQTQEQDAAVKTAWCGSPGQRQGHAVAANTAWCGSPGQQQGQQDAANTAWGGSPAQVLAA